MNLWLTIGIVTITYIGIAIGRWPIIKSNRATIALMGVGLLLIFNQIRFEDLPGFIDFDTLILLFSMMIINANLKVAGFFTWAGGALVKVTRSPRLFLAAEILLVGFLSALFVNDTICLMFTPFILSLTLAINRNPIPYLIALATASNIGSVATLTGNPQNMIIGIASGITYISFSKALLPVALFGLGSIWLVITWIYRFEFKPDNFPALPPSDQIPNRWMLIKVLVVTGGLLVAFLVGVPIALASFLAACILLFTRRTSPQTVFAEFDWSLLVFFAGLFIISGSLEANGVTQRLFELTDLGSKTNIWSFSLIIVILSNLVSNVPAVLLLRPVVEILQNPTAGWLTLAATSTLAGNLTLLGSVANLIVAEIADRYRVTLSFWEYTKAGVIITILSLMTGVLYIWLVIWK
jgi:Na+/H+ antiporter NhaD/arsenite permease-like protein